MIIETNKHILGHQFSRTKVVTHLTGDVFPNYKAKFDLEPGFVLLSPFLRCCQIFSSVLNVKNFLKMKITSSTFPTKFEVSENWTDVRKSFLVKVNSLNEDIKDMTFLFNKLFEVL